MYDQQLGPLLAQAQAARQRGASVEEARLLDAALAIAPTDPRVLNARGMRALADGDATRAREWFARAADADPKEPALRMNLATACRTLADTAGERAALEAALEIDRTHFVAQLRMAELSERTGAQAAAMTHWQAVVQMAEASPERPPAVADALDRGRAFLAAFGATMGAAIDAAFPRLADERRLKTCIDTMLGRRRIFTNECHGLHYPFLPADEYFDRAHFPWFDKLEAKTDAIRDEALALMASGDAAIRPYVRQERGTPANKWSPLDGSMDWSACFLIEYGAENAAVCDACPETAKALAAVPQNHIPGKAPTAFFSLLKPGAHIPPHTGVTNTRAIIHLPLVVPDGCRFRVGGETRAWREGEAFGFDDTIEHEAWNESDHPRIVLIFDVWNPHLTAAEQAGLVKLFEVSAGFEG